MTNHILFSGAYKPNSNKLNITWSLLTSCNYKCPYCHIRGNSIADDKTIQQTLSFLSKIKHKQLIITLFGGEPTIHPKIIEICETLRTFATVFVFTNLSFDMILYKKLASLGIKFNCSYHKDMINQIDFISKLNQLNLNDINYVNILYRDGISDVLNFCVNKKLNHRLSPISGSSDISDYIPCIKHHKQTNSNIFDTIIVSNTGQIKSLIDTEMCFYKHNKFKSYSCEAGYSSLFIDDKGNVYRCVNDLDNKTILTTVYDNFIPSKCICSYEECSCEFFIPKELYEGVTNNINLDILEVLNK